MAEDSLDPVSLEQPVPCTKQLRGIRGNLMLAYSVEIPLTEVGSEMARDRNDVADIQMDAAGLYREEAFTDRQVGTLQQLLPITADGRPDATRPVLFMGQTQVLTPAGALPLSFEIEATTLQEAVARFGEHARQALASTMQRLEEMRREAASSIIVPSGGMPGTPPGGRNIQMP
jgi:hypothetical protein